MEPAHNAVLGPLLVNQILLLIVLVKVDISTHLYLLHLLLVLHVKMHIHWLVHLLQLVWLVLQDII